MSKYQPSKTKILSLLNSEFPETKVWKETDIIYENYTNHFKLYISDNITSLNQSKIREIFTAYTVYANLFPSGEMKIHDLSEQGKVGIVGNLKGS